MSVKHYDIPNQARFLTYSCFQRLPLLADPDVRTRYVHEIATQSARLSLDVIAYVVMPEHVHLIVLPRDGKISGVLRGLKQGFGRAMLEQMREREDPMLQRLIGTHGKALFRQRGGGYDRNLRDASELREKIEYIHQNPVQRGIAARATDWEWSSARGYAGEAGSVELKRGW